MLTYLKNNMSFKIFFILIIVFYSNYIFTKENKLVCNTLLEVLEVNTNSYKSCLLKDAGDSFNLDELNACKRYFLIEIERLSYVYKNTCK